MTRSIFGSSYPPGCSGPPEPPAEPCVLCGEFEDNCKCPECFECGEVACLEHMPFEALCDLVRVRNYQAMQLTLILEYRRRENPVVCPQCQKSLPRPINGDPAYCDACQEVF